MPPEAALALPAAPSSPQQPTAPSAAVPATQRTAKQRKRDFRRDRRRRRRISERLAADPTLTDCTKTVALAALRYSDDSAKPVYPSVGALAAAASCQRRSARRCIVDLVEAGYIRRIQRPIAARRNATNLYYFCEPLGPPAGHREGQRRRPRTRIGRIPSDQANTDTLDRNQDSQNPSSHRRTPESPEPAEQVPNPPPMEPSASAPSASSRKTTAKFTARPRPPAPAPFQPPQPTPEPNPSIARTHLQAARDALRLPTTPHRRRPEAPQPLNVHQDPKAKRESPTATRSE